MTFHSSKLEMMPCKSPEPLDENTNLPPPPPPPPPCKQSFVHKFREHCNFDEALIHRQIKYSSHPSSLSPLILQTLACEAAAGACPSYLWETGGSHPGRVATLSPRNKKTRKQPSGPTDSKVLTASPRGVSTDCGRKPEMSENHNRPAVNQQ